MADLALLGVAASGLERVLFRLLGEASVSECLNPGSVFPVVTFRTGLLAPVQCVVFGMLVPRSELLMSSGSLSLDAGGSVTS